MTGCAFDAAYQGVPGAFSEEAARMFVGGDARLLACESLEDVMRAVVTGSAAAAVVPVENSLAGAVPGAMDVIATSEVGATAEVVLPIRHALIGVPGSTLAEVRRVHSHPVALAQCRRLFATYPHLIPVPAFDTAGAAAQLVERGDRTSAAIAGRRASALYGGHVLLADVADRPDNATRFLLVTPSAGRPAPDFRAGWKTTVVCVWPNRPGALARGLLPLVSRGLNLSRIESRPVGDVPFEYSFLLDIDPTPDVGALLEALDQLSRGARVFRLIGHYPAAPGSRHRSRSPSA